MRLAMLATRWLVVATIMLFLAQGLAAATPPRDNAVVMAIITGIVRGVTVHRGNKSFQGEVRMRLLEGDLLVTGQAEKCVILLSDNSEIKLNENTRMVLSRGVAPTTKKKKTILTLLFGELFANITKEKTREFEVRAGRAVAAIEGTQLDCRWPKGSPAATLFVVTGKVLYYGMDTPRSAWNVIPYNYRCDYRQAKPPAMAMTQPVIVPDMRIEVGWSENIRKYVQTIAEAITLSRQVLQSTQAAGGVMPRSLAEQLNETIREFDQIKHDASFDVGHKAIYTALINFRRCAAVNDQSLCVTASQYYGRGIIAFEQYQQQYMADITMLHGESVAIQGDMQGNMAECGKECSSDADCPKGCPKCIDSRVRYGDPWKKKCLTAEWAAQHASWLCLDDCYRKYTQCLVDNWNAYDACVEAAGNTHIKGEHFDLQAFYKANDACKSRRDNGIDACEKARKACEANCPHR